MRARARALFSMPMRSVRRRTTLAAVGALLFACGGSTVDIAEPGDASESADADAGHAEEVPETGERDSTLPSAQDATTSGNDAGSLADADATNDGDAQTLDVDAASNDADADLASDADASTADAGVSIMMPN